MSFMIFNCVLTEFYDFNDCLLKLMIWKQKAGFRSHFGSRGVAAVCCAIEAWARLAWRAYVARFAILIEAMEHEERRGFPFSFWYDEADDGQDHALLRDFASYDEVTAARATGDPPPPRSVDYSAGTGPAAEGRGLAAECKGCGEVAPTCHAKVWNHQCNWTWLARCHGWHVRKGNFWCGDCWPGMWPVSRDEADNYLCRIHFRELYGQGQGAPPPPVGPVPPPPPPPGLREERGTDVQRSLPPRSSKEVGTDEQGNSLPRVLALCDQETKESVTAQEEEESVKSADEECVESQEVEAECVGSALGFVSISGAEPGEFEA